MIVITKYFVYQMAYLSVYIMHLCIVHYVHCAPTADMPLFGNIISNGCYSLFVCCWEGDVASGLGWDVKRSG